MTKPLDEAGLERRRMRQREYMARFRRTAKGKAARDRYNRSPKRRAAMKRWASKGNAAAAQRRQREAGKEAMAIRKYRSKPEVRAHGLARQKQWRRERKAEEHLEVNGDRAELTKGGLAERITSLEQLVKFCQIDTKVWSVERWVCNKWEVGAKDAKGKLNVEPLFQVKVWLVRDREQVKAREWVENLLELARKNAPTAYKTIRRAATPNTGILVEHSKPDHHFAKLGWEPETGDASYDLKEAERRWVESDDYTLDVIAPYKPERIVLPLGNDLYHYDTKQGTTTRGTQMDMDSRYPKMAETVERAVIGTIHKFLAVAPVHLLMMPGNHDELSSWWLGRLLAAWFRHEKRLTVDNQPAPRKYFEWGNVMVMWTHGNDGKIGQYSQFMATERPQMWARCPIREAHSGDKHHRFTQEQHGVAVRILPTLCGLDAWSARSGFIGNVPMSETYVFHRERGHMATLNYTLPDYMKRWKAA